MNVVKKQVSASLRLELEAILQTHLNHFTTPSKLINHKLLYCNKWAENKYAYLIPLLYAECAELKYNIDNHTLLQVNIINAPPDCVDQLFHIDYLGDSISYFIPFVELTDLNGTAYLNFLDPHNNIVYYNELLKMSALYLTQSEIILYFAKLMLILNVDYEFASANSDAFALLQMPNYVYHRGQKNKSGKDRLMVNILFSINNAYSYPIDEIISDSEIDEIDRSEEILQKRNLLHLCTIKSPTSLAFISSKGNSYHAQEMCEGVTATQVEPKTTTLYTKITT